MADEGATPVIRGLTSFDLSLQCQTIYGALNACQRDYITVKGITFGSVGGGSRWVYLEDSHHWLFKNCSFDDLEDEASGSIELRNCAHIYFIACSFTSPGEIPEKTVTTHITNRNSTQLLFKNCFFGRAYDKCYYDTDLEAGLDAKIVFKECVFENPYHSGINPSSPPGYEFFLVEDCTFKNTGTLDNPRNPACIGGVPIAIYFSKAIFRRNTFFNNVQGGMVLSTYGPWHDFEHNWIYHNTIYDAIHVPHCVEADYHKDITGTVLDLQSDNDRFVRNNVFLNNIFWKAENEKWQVFTHENNGGIQDNAFGYNIIGDPDKESKIRYQGSTHTLEWMEQNVPGWLPNTSFTIGPAFSAPQEPFRDFTLQDSSPAIDKGTFFTTVVNVNSLTHSITVEGNTTFAFFDGWSFPTEYIKPDTVFTNTHVSSQVVDIDHNTGVITLQDASGFQVGDRLTNIDFHGSAPDIGANEHLSPSHTSFRSSIILSSSFDPPLSSSFVCEVGTSGCPCGGSQDLCHDGLFCDFGDTCVPLSHAFLNRPILFLAPLAIQSIL